MIQDIYPHKLINAYCPCTPTEGDAAMIYDDRGRLLAREAAGQIAFPAVGEVCAQGAQYLFTVDDRRYFLLPGAEGSSPEGYQYLNITQLRDLAPGKELFAAFTAYHLWRWYRDNRFCGRCGVPMGHSPTERSLKCPACGQVVYPRLNPAVIVGVISGDCLLLTRYKTGFAYNALVAGFCEIGETLEETVAREVYEETGLEVEHIRYYKSQPWGMAQDLLAGFFCEAKGDDIRVDRSELKESRFVRREDIELQPNDLSLTNEMMRLFRDGKI